MSCLRSSWPFLLLFFGRLRAANPEQSGRPGSGHWSKTGRPVVGDLYLRINRRARSAPAPQPRLELRIAPEAGALLLPDLQIGQLAARFARLETPTHHDVCTGCPC